MDFLKTIGGKIVSGLVAVAVIAIAISWWQMDPSTRHTIVSSTGKITGWLMIVILTPGVTFFVVGWVHSMDSNAAGALLVLIYTAIEAVVLAWLFEWGVHGSSRIVVFSAAVLLAGAYNLFACDWIAEKVE